MKNPIATWTLWCRRADSIIEFEVGLGAPYRDGDMWRCEWSLGALFDHPLHAAQSDSSMHALACAQVGISGYLHARQKAGDRFYMASDATSEALMEDLDHFLPSLNIHNPEAQSGPGE